MCLDLLLKMDRIFWSAGNSENKYKPSEPIGFKISILQSYLCDYSDGYTVVKGIINVNVTNPNNNAHYEKLTFKNNAPFISCISKINNTLIDNAEDLDIVMPMCNLNDYSRNYSKTERSLWKFITEINRIVVQKKIQIIPSEVQNILIVKQALLKY